MSLLLCGSEQFDLLEAEQWLPETREERGRRGWPRVPSYSERRGTRSGGQNPEGGQVNNKVLYIPELLEERFLNEFTIKKMVTI